MLLPIKEHLIEERVYFFNRYFYRTPVGYFRSFTYDKFWVKIPKYEFESIKKKIKDEKKTIQGTFSELD